MSLPQLPEELCVVLQAPDLQPGQGGLKLFSSKALLCSPHFTEQIQRWQDQQQQPPNNSSISPDITLTLSSAAYVPAALAVLAVLSGAQPEILQDLPAAQQVAAVVLMDRVLQVPHLSAAAVDNLVSQCGSSAAFAAAVAASLAALPDIPEPLLAAVPAVFAHFESDPGSLDSSLVQRLAVAVYGDLDAVMAKDNSSKTMSFLQLPSDVMLLLLASDDLKVTSEDTVLAAAQMYSTFHDSSLGSDHFPWMVGSSPSAVRDSLAALIRVPHLSRHALLTAVASSDKSFLLGPSFEHRAGMVSLVSLLLGTAGASNSSGITAEQIRQLLPDGPESWLRGLRAIQPLRPLTLRMASTVYGLRSLCATVAAYQPDPARFRENSGEPCGLGDEGPSIWHAGFMWEPKHEPSTPSGLRCCVVVRRA